MNRIRERWRKVTPPPWTVLSVPRRDGPASFGIVQERRMVGQGRVAESADRIDAEAIAHAPEDVAELLGEIDRQKKVIDGLVVWIAGLAESVEERAPSQGPHSHEARKISGELREMAMQCVEATHGR